MIIGDASSWEELFEQNLVPSVLAHVLKTWSRCQSQGRLT